MTSSSHPHPSRPRLPLWLVTCLLASTGTFLLWTERQGSQKLGALPYLLLLACPVLHLAVHRAYPRRPPRGSAREHDEGGPRGASR
jgi:hypothetical protein